MIRRTMTVAGTEYAVAVTQDFAAMQASAVDAVQAGGGLVALDALDGTTISVLVSPWLPLVFKEREVAPDDTIRQGEPSAADFLSLWDYR